MWQFPGKICHTHSLIFPGLLLGETGKGVEHNTHTTTTIMKGVEHTHTPPTYHHPPPPAPVLMKMAHRDPVCAWLAAHGAAATTGCPSVSSPTPSTGHPSPGRHSHAPSTQDLDSQAFGSRPWLCPELTRPGGGGQGRPHCCLGVFSKSALGCPYRVILREELQLLLLDSWEQQVSKTETCQIRSWRGQEGTPLGRWGRDARAAAESLLPRAALETQGAALDGESCPVCVSEGGISGPWSRTGKGQQPAVVQGQSLEVLEVPSPA